MIPDIGMLSSRVRTCLQLQESLNNSSHLLFSADNINSLIDTKLCSLNTSMLPDTLNAYKTLNVPHNQLQLIPPTFNDTLPVLQFAVSIFFFLTRKKIINKKYYFIYRSIHHLFKNYHLRF